MKSLNRFTCIGNIGSVGELKFVGENKVVDFSVALNRKDRNGDQTEWVSCVAWNKIAENAKTYLSKGDGVYVEGELRTRSWEKDGQRHYKTEVLVRDLLFISKANSSGKRDANEHREPNPAPAPSHRKVASAMPSRNDHEEELFNEDDLPF